MMFDLNPTKKIMNHIHCLFLYDASFSLVNAFSYEAMSSCVLHNHDGDVLENYQPLLILFLKPAVDDG